MSDREDPYAGVPPHQRPPTGMMAARTEHVPPKPKAEQVDHPAHYGGADNPYEAIKVIEAWDLGFCLGNTVKYIARAEHKGATAQDLKKALWYLQREITARER